ncbi:MAG: beta-N-acetylhexosaminidase [Akkermansiaceae bacterium]
MRNIITPLVLLAGFTSLHAQQLPVIPRPNKVQITQGQHLKINPSTQVIANKELANEANYLAYTLQMHLGTAKPNPIANQAPAATPAIHLQLKDGLKDTHVLEITSKGITLTGGSPHAVFHGIQTILQLTSPAKENTTTLPACKITDSPKYKWRGLMIDPARHFLTIKEIKAFIEQMARYKYNLLHIHLTDDQGWRLEIKSRPKLTSVGAWRVHREGTWWYRPAPRKGEKTTYGGFYTQKQIKDLVAFAKTRHIEIMPEIDVPGHCMSVLAGYPELATGKGPFHVNVGSKFFNIIENTLDPSNPATYTFIDQVIGEAAKLFPFPYIHIGGDEVPKKFWAKDPDVKAYMKKHNIKDMHHLQSHFFGRVEKILNKHGKKLIGWDEILDGGLSETATVMSWRGKDGGIKAARMGRQVVMAPNSGYYLDLYQGHLDIEPETYSKARLKKTYTLDPSLPKDAKQELLLGVHGCLWGEEIPNYRHLQYMAWPRAFAIAEAGWSGQPRNEWQNFIQRVEYQFSYFDRFDWNYATSIYDPIIKMKKEKDGNNYITLTPEVDGVTFHYTFDQTIPDHTYPVAKGPLKVPVGANTIRTRSYYKGKPVNHPTRIELWRVKASKRVPPGATKIHGFP